MASVTRWLDALLHPGEVAELRDALVNAHKMAAEYRAEIKARNYHVRDLTADLPGPPISSRSAMTYALTEFLRAAMATGALLLFLVWVAYPQITADRQPPPPPPDPPRIRAHRRAYDWEDE